MAKHDSKVKPIEPNQQSVPEALYELEAAALRLDVAREALATAESDYSKASGSFEAAVAQTRKSCAR